MKASLPPWSARGLALTAVLLLPYGARAQPAASPATDWQAANREVIALVQAGHYAEAEAKAEAARALCPKGESPMETAARVVCQSLLQENTAWAQARAGRYAEAEANYKAALAAREQAFTANDLAIGDSAAALGMFYMDRQRWDDAAAQLERAVEIIGRGGPDRTPTLAAAYAQLSDAYRAQGRMNAALTTAREAVEALTRRAGAEAAQTQLARANLAALLRDTGQGAEAMDMALAALRPETLPLDQRVRFTIEAVTTANALGRTEAVRAAFDTTFSLVAHWADTGDATQRQGFVQLALAGSELALNRGDPDSALSLARQAQAVIADSAGKLDGRAPEALIQEARALLEQRQAEEAATLLTDATKAAAPAQPSPTLRAWTVRALMDAGRTTEARARLEELQASIVGRPEERSAFAASLLQLDAQLAERSGNRRAALAALEQAMAMLPPPGANTANAVQAVNIRRDAIRLRATLGDTANTASALSDLIETQTKAQMPLASLLETRLLLGWFGAETRDLALLRTQIDAVDSALPALAEQAPRAAAVMLTRLADLSLALPGGDGAAGAMAFLERARMAFEHTGQSEREAAQGAILRGRILLRLERPGEASGECRGAEDTLTQLLPGAEPALRDALTCAARAELQMGQFVQAGRTVARLLEHIPDSHRVERAEAMRLLADAQSGQARPAEIDAADRTLRAALDLVADVAPRRAALRAEIWGAISTNLHRAGREREARNAAVAQRQVAGEDNAGMVMTMQSLRLEATALLALQQLDEAVSVLDRAERLRVSLLRIDPGLLQEHDTLMARVELARGHYAEAVSLADHVIAAYRAQPTASRLGMASILEVRAAAQLAAGSFIAAETAEREALGQLSGFPLQAARARLDLARIIAARGDLEAATRERDMALTVLTRLRGANSPAVALARLDTIPALVRAGKTAQAETEIDACLAALADREDGQRAQCFMARATMLARAGAWVAARDAAKPALDILRAQGDHDRPALVGPLLVMAEAADATGDDAGLADALATLSPLLARATLEERLRGAVVQARQQLRAGDFAAAATSGQDGLALLAANLPANFAGTLVGLTDATARGLIAQGRGTTAAGLWQAALKRLDGWGGAASWRGQALRGLGTALLETPDLAGALAAWDQAVALADQPEAAQLTAVAGSVHAALAAGRFEDARSRADRLAASPASGAPLALAMLRAEIAEQSGDSVSAVLEWWRAASLTGEIPTEADTAVLVLLRTARAALAAGQAPQAADLLAKAKKALPDPTAGSDVALAMLEMTARMAAEAPDNAAALAAAAAWADAVNHHDGAASRAAVEPQLLIAKLDARGGENADAAALLAAALGQAERLRGRGSLLWARIAMQAADASARLGDDGRAAALRAEAGKVLAR